MGEKERALEWIERAVLIDPDNLNMRYNFGCALAGDLGAEDDALAMLQRVFASGSESMIRIAEIDVDLDSCAAIRASRRCLRNARKRLGLDKAAPTAGT